MQRPDAPHIDLLIVEPPSGINVNLPNMDVAFAATALGARVIDLHACPWPGRRYLDTGARRVAISRRSFNLGSARHLRAELARERPEVEVLDLHGPVDVQCCYPFVREAGTLEVDLSFGDDLPLPDYTLFDSFGLLRACWRSGLWAYTVMTSLGCPFGCAFCAARRRPWRPRSPGHVVAELARARRDWGIVSFEIIDDAFNVDKQRVLELCERVAPLGLRWSCTNGLRADRFDEEQARAMAAAGCVHVGFGVESTSDAVLERMGKGETFDHIQRAVAVAQQHLPRVSGFFIVGLPGSTRASDLASVRWAESIGLDAVFSLYLPDSGSSSDQVFYGSSVQARGDAYPRQQQLQVYARAKALKRRRYRALVVGRAGLRTLEAMGRAGWTGRANLVGLAARRLPGMMIRGEIQ